MIEKLIVALNSKLKLTGEEIADALWLALHIQQSESVSSSTIQSNPTLLNDPEKADDPLLNQTQDNIKSDVSSSSQKKSPEQEPQADICTQEKDTFGSNSGNLVFKVPNARSVREPLTLTRAMRPLMRRVPSSTNTVLDEAATVQRIADEQNWIPVLKPAMEPWLDIALVVDESTSMLIWEHTIGEFKRLLEHYGIFRDVRTWGLKPDDRGQIQIHSRISIAASKQCLRSPNELIDPSGRCLILLVSDCVSAFWHNGTLLPILKLWTQSNPMAIIQMLPEWLWARTGLGLGAAVHLQALAPGVPNQQLIARGVSRRTRVNLETGIKIPIVTLEPDRFTAWAQMVSGKGNTRSPGVVFDPNRAAPSESIERHSSPAPEISPDERVQRFRITASEMARRLAGILAAAPVITLPIVRIIQDRIQILQKSQQVHVAEVFLGGLLKPLSEINADTSADYVQYDFINGVREILLESVPSSEIVNVLNEVSNFVADRVGLSPEDFVAELRKPGQEGNGQFAIRPFARVTAQVLKQLGGEYARFAEELEQENQIGSESELDSKQVSPQISKLDLREFFQASDPSRTLFVNNISDGKYYIDFSSVRGGDILGKLKQKITFFKPNEPTCTLFTGHIGCGKSTELLRLQAELEKSGFHVVYCESSEDLEMADVDIADVLLAIARRVSQSLDKITLESPNKFNELLQGAWKVLNSEVTREKLKVPVLGDVGLSAEKEKLSLSVGIGEITAKMKNDPMLREKLNQYLGPQKVKLLEAINQELLEPAIAKLKQQGKNGLVVIVDNLDRIDNRAKPWGRPQQEYLFVDQGEFLTKLNCHLIYTMPLSLKFSNDYGMLTQRFPEDPKVLPMVPVQWSDGSVHIQGMSLMQQMVLARAFPDMTPEERLNKVTEIFDSAASLERLCQMSGGHLRDVLRLLNTWIQEEMTLPLSRNTLEQVIRSRRNEIMLTIYEDEWQLLRHVKERKKVSDDQGYEKLIRSRFVFEYRDGGESWFDVNPILAEARELRI